jgi:hypothetical protein
MCKLIFKSSIIEIPAFRFAPAGMTGELLPIVELILYFIARLVSRSPKTIFTRLDHHHWKHLIYDFVDTIIDCEC